MFQVAGPVTMANASQALAACTAAIDGLGTLRQCNEYPTYWRVSIL